MIASVALVVVGACGTDADLGDDEVSAVEPSDEELADSKADTVLGPELRMTNQPAFTASTFGNARSIIASGSTLHMILMDERTRTGQEPQLNGQCIGCTPAREIYYRRSLNNGQTWQPLVRITNRLGESEFPAMAVSGTVVHAVWVDRRDGNREIYYARSTDNGATWSANNRLTSNAADSVHPSIAVSGSTVHVVWHDARAGSREVFYKRSTTAGTSWEADRRLTVTPGSSSVYASVASSGSDVHLAYETHRHGNPEIMYMRSADGGTAWSSEVRLTNNPSRSFSPSISVANNRVHVAWHDNPGGRWTAMHKRSTDRGTTWGPDTGLSGPAAIASFVQVAAGTSNDAMVVWGDERHGGRNIEIYMARSTNGGATWGAERRLTFDVNRSNDPAVEISGDRAFVMWTDARDGWATGAYNGNYEIYLRQLTF